MLSLNSDTESPIKERKEKKVYLGIELKKDFTYVQFATIPLLVMTVFTIISFTNAKQIMLLRDPNYFNVPEERIGRTTNDMIFYTQVVSVFYLAIVGYLYDLLGRKVTIISNLLLASISVALIPYTSPSIYPWLFLVRSIIVAGV